VRGQALERTRGLHALAASQQAQPGAFDRAQHLVVALLLDHFTFLG